MEKIILVLMFITFGTTSAADGTKSALVLSCDSKDLPCLNNSTHLFLQQTQQGMPLLRIQPIDPLVIKSLQYYGLIGAAYKFTDVTVSGLKDIIVSDFKMDMDAKSVVLTTNGYVTVTGQLEIAPVVKDVTPSESVSFTTQAISSVTHKYNYNLKKDQNGVEYFEVGPEQFECKALGPIKSNLGLFKAKHVQEAVLCFLLKDAYKVVIQNIREATKFIPAKDFIKNIH